MTLLSLKVQCASVLAAREEMQTKSKATGENLSALTKTVHTSYSAPLMHALTYTKFSHALILCDNREPHLRLLMSLGRERMKRGLRSKR